MRGGRFSQHLKREPSLREVRDLDTQMAKIED